METSVPVIDKHHGHPPHQPAAECWQAYLSNDELPELAFFCASGQSASSATISRRGCPQAASSEVNVGA
jgi:hypothetical protein